MFQKKKNPVTLEGVVRLKVINSPAYINKLAREAYSLFDSNEAQETIARLAYVSGNKPVQDLIHPGFEEQIAKMVSKYSVNSGVFKEFMMGKVTFYPKEKITIRHDVIAEITLRDGIITKIDPVPLPEPF